MATTSGPHSDPTRSRVASLSAKEYVEKFKLDMYMKDVVRLVLGRRDERPISTVYTYYKNVCAGEHVAGREYEYIFAAHALVVYWRMMFCEVISIIIFSWFPVDK